MPLSPTTRDFILLLLYVLVPWTADQFGRLLSIAPRPVRRRFVLPAGRRRLWPKSTVQQSPATCLESWCRLPFVTWRALYGSGGGKAMGGIDLSWIVGLAVTSARLLLVGQARPAAARAQLPWPLPRRRVSLRARKNQPTSAYWGGNRFGRS